VLAETRSPAKAGVVGFAQTLPFMVFSLPAGALVDRWNRKHVMLVAEAGRAVALGSIGVVLAFGTIPYAQIVVVAFVEGSLFVFFRLAESAALPQVVPREQLATAIAQNQARDQGADLVGQPVGGLLFGIGRLLPFVVDAASYAVSFVTLLFVRPAFQEAREPRPLRIRADVAEGAAWLWRQPFLRMTILLVSGSNLAFSAVFLALIVRAKNLGASPSVIGLMFGFIGAGALVGATLAPTVQRRVAANLVVIGSLWIWAVVAFTLVVLTNVYALGAVWAAAGVFGPVFNVTLSSYRYALVPDRLLARVQSAALVVAWGAIPLGSLTAGLLLSRFGAVTTLLALAVVMGVVAVGALGSRSIREAPKIEELLAADAG